MKYIQYPVGTRQCRVPTRTMYLTYQKSAVSIPVVLELILPEIRTRQCRVPTIDSGRETALPCPLYYSGAAGIDIIPHETVYPVIDPDVCQRLGLSVP